MNSPHRFCSAVALVLCSGLLLAGTAIARESAAPYSWTHATRMQATEVPVRSLPAVDAARELAQDARAMDPAKSPTGAVEKRLRVAVGGVVAITPDSEGAWETLDDGARLWRLTVSAPGATDLHFGFSRFQVARGVTLHVIDESAHVYDGAYTAADTSPDGQLWLPPVSGDRLTLELYVPAGANYAADAVMLSSVGSGYRDVNERNGTGLFGAGQSGTCNIDVVCPLGDNYRDEIRAVVKYYFNSGGSTYLCTGSLVNNTEQDFKNYFLSANHCISTQAEATSMRFIFNYQSPTCGAHGGGSTSQQLTGGAQLRAHRADVDVSLTELNNTPPEDYHVFYAGWDATGVVPDGAIGIHHPSGWVKAITETDHALTTMNSCIGSGGSSTHWRTGSPYSQGTTEGGSSGSAIFVPSGDASGNGNLIIGTLSGGSAACSGSVPNSGYDCYGKFSVAWDGASAAQRLKDWLDPNDSGTTTLAGANPGGGAPAPTLAVDPSSLEASADAGATTSATLSIGNSGTADLTWNADTASASCDSPDAVSWLSLDPASGTIAVGDPAASVDVTFDASGLDPGSYEANICVHSNDTAHDPLAVPVTFTVNAVGPVSCSVEDTIFCDGFDVTAPVGVVLSEGFDDITTLPAGGWLEQNNSEGIGTTAWFQSDGSVFGAQSGDDTSFIGANFNNTDGGESGGEGTISNWLATPLLTFDAESSLAFYTRSTIGSDGVSVYPDRIEVRLCTNAPCDNFGTGADDTGDYETLLLSVNPDLGTEDDPTGAAGYPLSDWAPFTVDGGSGLPDSGQGRIAFRYFVTDAGPTASNSNYVGIDTVEIHAAAIEAGLSRPFVELVAPPTRMDARSR